MVLKPYSLQKNEVQCVGHVRGGGGGGGGG